MNKRRFEHKNYSWNAHARYLHRNRKYCSLFWVMCIVSLNLLNFWGINDKSQIKCSHSSNACFQSGIRPLIIIWMWWAFSSGAKSYRHSFLPWILGADGISQEVCGGWEMCREGSAPFVEHKSHLSQIRTGAALVCFDVPLGEGLGEVRRGGGDGADRWSTNRCSRLILWGSDETLPQWESFHPSVSQLTQRQG